MQINDVADFSLIKRVYDELFGIVEEFDDPLRAKAIIAGGCFPSLLAKTRIKDIDVFSDSPAILIDHLTAKGLKISFESDFICNFKHKNLTIQIIKSHTFETIAATIAAFDYTIVCCGYDGENLEYHDRFFLDNAQKRLVVNELPKPLSTMRRLAKYSKRGYAACPVGLGKLARAIHSLQIDWDNPAENSIDFYPDGTPTFRGLD